MSSTKLAVRIDPENPNHHLQNNHGTWWCHFTVHNDDGTKERRRVSLKTTDISEARRLRDELLAGFVEVGGPPECERRQRANRVRSNPETFFKPAELAVLAQYLHKPQLLPHSAKRFYPCGTVDPLDWDEESAGIVPVLDLWRQDSALALDNAVARICLSGVQEALPQWATSDGDGTVIFGRTVQSPLELPPRILLRRHLFTINWADSGPGYSWPEAYWATELPYFDAVVVTASQDSPDAHGYCDTAIGWFNRSDDREKQVAEIIKGFWSYQALNGQEAWAYLFDIGEIDAESAKAWAEEVWAEQTADEP